MASLRQKYWLIGGTSSVRRVIHPCTVCRRLNAHRETQQMADLPASRVDDSSPPFTRRGINYFGPFMVKQGRKEVKNYGALFTCLASRAIHLEVTTSMETDTFINVLDRVIAPRGNIKELWSDNGTNFVGANKELKRALLEIDQERVDHKMRSASITWHFNPPGASAMGGVWDRMIQAVWKFLNGLLLEHGPQLNPDEFHTLLCEWKPSSTRGH